MNLHEKHTLLKSKLIEKYIYILALTKTIIEFHTNKNSHNFIFAIDESYILIA